MLSLGELRGLERWRMRRGLRMTGRSSLTTLVAIATLGIAALSLAACEGIEVNGKLVNALGITGTCKGKEPQVAQRAGIVLPPSTTGSLPVPGSGPVAAVASAEWPEDPDQKAARLAAEKEQRDAEEKCQAMEDDGNNVPGPLRKLKHTPGQRCGLLFGDLFKNINKQPDAQ